MSGDLYYNNVSLLLHCDGTNASTTFTDNSPSVKTVTANGNAQISTAQSKYGGASGSFDGTGDYLTIPNNTDFSFGTGDFTIEFWVYATSLTNSPMVFHKCSSSSGSNTGWFIELASNTVYFGWGTDVVNTNYKAFTVTLTTATWYHIAVTRTGTTINCFVNGTSPGSATLTNAGNNHDNTSQVVIGGGDSVFSTLGLNGYVDDLRITKGIVRYTSNFTAPTAAFPNHIIYELVGSGNINLSGTSTFSKLTHSHFLTGSGNITLSGSTGTFHVQRHRAITGSGNIHLSGTSTFSYTERGKLHGSGLITLYGTSLFDVRRIGAASSSIILSSTLLYHQLDSIYESIILSANEPNNVINKNLITDYFNILDLILLTFKGNIAENITLTPTLTGVIHQIEKIISQILVNASVNTKLTAINQLVSLINVLESLDYIYVGSISETLTITASINSLYKSIRVVLESLLITPSFSMNYVQMLSITDNISVSGSVLSKGILKNGLSDSFILSIPTSSGQDTYLAYLLSPETNSVSNYNNYKFDGCTKFGKKYLFYNKSGLYEYGGTKDDGTTIKSYVETVAYNFGTSNLKQVPSIYLGWSTSGATILKVRVDDKAEIVYKLNKKTKNLDTQKIDIGKGLIGRYFQFEIINDVDDFSLESIEFYPIELKRKL